jgi:hypothetical protein
MPNPTTKQDQLRRLREEMFAASERASAPRPATRIVTPVTQNVTPVTKNVTSVTRNVTPVTQGVTPCPECERLRKENADLKRQLAEAKAPPLTAAERARRHRERKRNGGNAPATGL